MPQVVGPGSVVLKNSTVRNPQSQALYIGDGASGTAFLNDGSCLDTTYGNSPTVWLLGGTLIANGGKITHSIAPTDGLYSAVRINGGCFKLCGKSTLLGEENLGCRAVTIYNGTFEIDCITNWNAIDWNNNSTNPVYIAKPESGKSGGIVNMYSGNICSYSNYYTVVVQYGGMFNKTGGSLNYKVLFYNSDGTKSEETM